MRSDERADFRDRSWKTHSVCRSKECGHNRRDRAGYALNAWGRSVEMIDPVRHCHETSIVRHFISVSAVTFRGIFFRTHLRTIKEE